MSPRSQKQLDEIREQSKEKILSAALELFAFQGYHNASVAQIAKKAGVAKGLIYNYFESKEALLHGILMREIKLGDDFLARMLALETPQARLAMLINASFEMITLRPEYSKLLTMLSLQLDQFPSLTEMLTARYEHVMPMLEQLLADAGFEDPEMETQVLIAMLDGIGIRYIIMKEVSPLEEVKQYMLKRYCNQIPKS